MTNPRSEAQMAIRQTALNKLAKLKPPPESPVREWGSVRRGRQYSTAIAPLVASVFPGMITGIAAMSPNDTRGIVPALEIMTGSVAAPGVGYILSKAVEGAVKYKLRRGIEKQAIEDLANMAARESLIDPTVVVENPIRASGKGRKKKQQHILIGDELQGGMDSPPNRKRTRVENAVPARLVQRAVERLPPPKGMKALFYRELHGKFPARSISPAVPLAKMLKDLESDGSGKKVKFAKKYLKGQGLPATKKNVEKICNIMDVEGVVFD